MPKTLLQLTDDIVKTFDNYKKTGTTAWDYQIAAFDLVYQVGSLAKRIQQLNNNRYREGLTDEDINIKIADELADIMAEVLFIASELGIDMDTAWERMLGSDAEKIEERAS